MSRPRLAAALAVTLGAAAVFASFAPGLPLHWLFGLAFGWVLQRAGFCFVAAVRDPVLTGGTTLARGLLAAVATATVGFTVVTVLTGRPGTVAPAGLNTVVGGLLFGVGMVVAGGCVSGTLMRMGDGFVMQWVAFAGLLAGSLLGARACCSWSAPLFQGSRPVFLPDHLGWTAALGLQAAGLGLLWWLAARHERRRFGSLAGPASLTSGEAEAEADTSAEAAPSESHEAPTSLLVRLRTAAARAAIGGFSPLAGGLALGLLNVLYFALAGRPWGITTELTYWASALWRLFGQHPEEWAYFSSRGLVSGRTLLAHPGTALNLGIIAGAFLAPFVLSQWRLRPMKSWRHAVAALAGGVLMGFGARLSLGCNIGALFSGTASLSLHGWIYLVSLFAGSLLGVRVADAFLFQPALRRLRGNAPGRTGPGPAPVVRTGATQAHPGTPAKAVRPGR